MLHRALANDPEHAGEIEAAWAPADITISMASQSWQLDPDHVKWYVANILGGVLSNATAN
jgi:hypothetical protein